MANGRFKMQMLSNPGVCMACATDATRVRLLAGKPSDTGEEGRRFEQSHRQSQKISYIVSGVNVLSRLNPTV